MASRQAATSGQVALARLQTLRQLEVDHIQVLATLPRLSLRTSDQQAPYERILHDWAARPDRRGWTERLVIGQDDSNRTGLHRGEQEQLLELRRQGGLGSRVWLMSGADELSMDLVAGRLAEITNTHPKIAHLCSQAGAEQRISPSGKPAT